MLASGVGICCFFGLADYAISRKERSVAKKKEKAADAVGGFYSRVLTSGAASRVSTMCL
jgi:hypothetical protein